MMSNRPTVITLALSERGEMNLTQPYEDKGGMRPELRDSPVQWCHVTQKVTVQASAVLANRPIEERVKQNAERVQIILSHQRLVTLPHAM